MRAKYIPLGLQPAYTGRTMQRPYNRMARRLTFTLTLADGTVGSSVADQRDGGVIYSAQR